MHLFKDFFQLGRGFWLFCPQLGNCNLYHLSVSEFFLFIFVREEVTTCIYISHKNQRIPTVGFSTDSPWKPPRILRGKSPPCQPATSSSRVLSPLSFTFFGKLPRQFGWFVNPAIMRRKTCFFWDDGWQVFRMKLSKWKVYRDVTCYRVEGGSQHLTKDFFKNFLDLIIVSCFFFWKRWQLRGLW